MLSQGNWGQEPFGGSGVDFKCPEFVGCLDVSVGDWRKAVSRMAVARGPVLGHRGYFSEGVVPGPSGDALACESHV